MRRYIGINRENGGMLEGGENTFQVILYDPQARPTYSGDGDIVLQYKTVNNDPEVDVAEFDTPYATVGIVNLNGTDGMEYTYWNEYAAGAAELEDERAILFSTILIVVTGSVQGVVTDFETGELIAGAFVRGNLGSYTLTDENGAYVLENVLVGSGYTFTAGAAGYNSQTVESGDSIGFVIEEDDMIEVNFSLLHPDFALSEDDLRFELRPGFAAQSEITLSNGGNGPLEFRSHFDYLGGNQPDRWNKLLDFNVTEQTGDNRINGAIFYSGNFWVTGTNRMPNPPYYYLFNREGEFGDSIRQPDFSSYGFRGMMIIDSLLYGGQRDSIYSVNSMGEVQHSIPGPLQIQRALAYDGSEFIWVANSRDPLVKIDTDGAVIDEFEHELDIYGLGYFVDDPDGFPLYVLSRNLTDPDLDVAYALVSKFNPETGAFRVVTVLEGEPTDRGGGMEIVSTFDAAKWVMITVMNHPEGDRVSVYDMGPSTNWASYSPRRGYIPAGEDTVISITVNSSGLEEGEYGLILRFQHNAPGLMTDFPLMLSVDDEYSVESEKDALPYEFGLLNNYPNPFNSVSRVGFSLREGNLANVRIYDLEGRRMIELANGHFQAGSHWLTFDAAGLPSGIYIVRLNSGNRTDERKIVLLK